MKILKILISLYLFLQIPFTFAWVIDHFIVEFWKSTIKSWETVDLTIKAVDENDNVVTDYQWTIIGFSETDAEAELPEELASDDWYTFTLSDEWVVKFENAMMFVSLWEQELSIYSDDDLYILWQWIINVEKDAVSQSENIEILSPESDITIWSTKVNISWESKKNYEILIVLNDKDEFTTSTNSDWIFEKEIDNLENWENLIQAFILDADWNKIWESNKTIINVDSNLPQFKKITLAPIWENAEVDSWKSIIVNVYATKWLESASIIINDAIINLEETEDWVYTWNFKAPKESWEYLIDVTLKDTFWHKYEEKEAAKIVVKEVELQAATWDDQETTVSTTTDKITTNSWTIEEVNKEVKELKVVKLKNKSVLTWNPVEWANWYNVYKKINDSEMVLVESVEETKYEVEITWDEIKYEYFAVRPILEDSEWNTYEWDLSEATKIQTWPEIYVLILISLLLWWAFAYFRKKENI